MNVVSFSLESINNSSVSCFAVIKWQCVWPNIATGITTYFLSFL